MDMITLSMARACTKPVVFDLDAHGISIQGFALTGGGSGTVDASAIFNAIERGKNYLFRCAFLENTLDFPAAFYQYDENGSLANIGLCVKGCIENTWLQFDAVLWPDRLQMVITTLGS